MEETIKEISKDIVEVTKVETINLSKIKNEINEINTLLTSFPTLKTKADAETLEYWNNNNVYNNLEKNYLLDKKKNLEEILKKYEIIK